MNIKSRVLVALLAGVFSAAVGAADGDRGRPGTDRLRDTTPRELINEANTLDELAALNQGGASQKIASDFTDLAGSEGNASALVRSLRNGETVDLTGSTPTVTVSFDPPTGKMGWGNVFISLALAQESLTQAGVTDPTAAQLVTALNGGTLTVTLQDGTTKEVSVAGILAQRASGQGWGQIANSMGVKLGHVISAIKSENKSLQANLPARGEKGKSAERRQAAKDKSLDAREHSAQFTGHGERGEKADRPQRPEMAERGNGRGR